jgi:hypothetical protein
MSKIMFILLPLGDMYIAKVTIPLAITDNMV